MHDQRRPFFTLIAACCAAALLPAGSSRADADDRAQPLAEGEKKEEAGKYPECVKVSSQARYSGFGYDHVVEIDNTCEKAMACTVVTDVNKTASTLNVAPKKKDSVVTFRGSPAREFKADVSCKEQT